MVESYPSQSASRAAQELTITPAPYCLIPNQTLVMNADNDVQQRKSEKALPYSRHICVRAWDLLQEESTTVLSPKD